MCNFHFDAALAFPSLNQVIYSFAAGSRLIPVQTHVNKKLKYQKKKNNNNKLSMWDVYPGVVVNLHTSHHSHLGLAGYSKLINGLRAPASGAFVC